MKDDELPDVATIYQKGYNDLAAGASRAQRHEYGLLAVFQAGAKWIAEVVR